MPSSHPPMKQMIPEFYNHPIIKQLSSQKRWTVSDENKRPIDMQILRDRQEVFGAFAPSEICLVDLDESLDIISHPSNHAFYFDAEIDHLVVLDIEPSCPDDLKQHFLSMPYLYAETSLSGKGYHLIFPYPKDILEKYPEAMNKSVLKDPNKHFEILLQHYVTFTRNMLPDFNKPDNQDFITLFETLARQQKPSNRIDFSLLADNEPDIPHKQDILDILDRVRMNKTLDDYNGDYSNYEFAWAIRLKSQLDNILKVGRMRYVAYNNDQKTWLVYHILIEKLDHRIKHETQRNGLPWLLYIAQEAVAKQYTDKNKGD